MHMYMYKEATRSAADKSINASSHHLAPFAAFSHHRSAPSRSASHIAIIYVSPGSKSPDVWVLW